MGTKGHKVDEDYWYTEDQINPSVKIHAVSRKRSFFSTTDYILIAVASLGTAFIYKVRILRISDLISLSEGANRE